VIHRFAIWYRQRKRPSREPDEAGQVSYRLVGMHSNYRGLLLMAGAREPLIMDWASSACGPTIRVECMATNIFDMVKNRCDKVGDFLEVQFLCEIFCLFILFPHLLVLATSERRVSALAKIALKVPLLVGIVHWWPAPAGVGRVLDNQNLWDEITQS
jgi:hypothetical protein